HALLLLHSFPTRRSSDLQLQSSLSYLFQNDVSTDMLQAILELHRRGLSLVLGREYNSQLLQQCQEYLQEVREMRIITAIHISRRSEEHTSELQSRENLVC